MEQTEIPQQSKSLLSKIKKVLTEPRGGGSSGSLFFRFPLDEQISFAKRLSVLLKAGIPLLQALQMMQSQTTHSGAKVIVSDFVEGVQQGQFLYTRMEKYKKYFGEFAVNIIRVGEVSGSLNDNLTYLAHELKKKRDLRRKLISALVYPAFIVVATFGIAIMLVVYVFPKILPILQGFKGKLPVTTRTLIFTSHLLATKGWLIVLVLAVLLAVWIFFIRHIVSVRMFINRTSLRLPLLGKLFQSYYMANLCRTFGVLLKSEVPIVETASITANTATNLAYKRSLHKLTEHLTSGGKLSHFFGNEEGLYPVLIGQMTHVGESTGTLSDTLLYVADIYEQEVDELTKNLSTAIEPALMVLMGVLVGFIAMSIITPIYSITQSLSR
jgi:type II secretory pathway component PulF